MKFIWLIRHGQSLANIDAPTQNCVEVPLTEKGKEQAQALVEKLPCKPDRIIVSPYLRTQETAAPTIAAYPDAPVETWNDVREFTYLSQQRCGGTTRTQRLPLVTAYWENLDPDYRDGADAESFRMFLERTVKVVLRLKALPEEEENIFIFTHGQFLNGLVRTAAHPEMNVEERMQEFRQLPEIENCEMINLILP